MKKCNDFISGLEVAPCRKEKEHKSGHVYANDGAWEALKIVAIIHLKMLKNHFPCKHSYCGFCKGYDATEILWEEKQ